MGQVVSDTAGVPSPGVLTANQASLPPPQWPHRQAGVPVPQTPPQFAGAPVAAGLPTAIPAVVGMQTSLSPTPPTLPPPEVDIDLHKCFVDNAYIWKSAWTPIFELGGEATGASAEPPAMTDLMTSMVDVQLAMRRCDIGPAQEAMLFDTWEAGGKFKTDLNMPDTKVRTGAVPSLLSSALEDFKYRDWHAFGSQLGKAMQQMAVATFPEEYEVDDTGKLRRIIIEARELGQTGATWNKSMTVATVFSLASVAFTVLGLLVVFRSRTAILSVTRVSTQEYNRQELD